jgi:hypothetical protein
MAARQRFAWPLRWRQSRSANYERFENGTTAEPESGFVYSEQPFDPEKFYRQARGRERLRRVRQAAPENRGRAGEHGMLVLDKSVLDLPAPGIEPGEEVFLKKPVSVRDVFFYRGM